MEKEYTLEEISDLTKKLGHERTVRTLRNWFQNVNTSNGKHKPIKFFKKDVYEVLMQNGIGEKLAQEQIEKQDNIKYHQLQELRDEGYPINPEDFFDQNFGDEEEDIQQAEKYAESRKDDLILKLMLNFFIEKMGYRLNTKRLEQDLINKYIYDQVTFKSNLKNPAESFKSVQRLENLHAEDYFRKIRSDKKRK